MRTVIGSPGRAAVALAGLCTAWLAYDMVAMLVFKQKIFVERGAISAGGELTVLVGFVLVLLFNLASIVWTSLRIRKAQGTRRANWGTLAFGILCLILLVGAKALADEIAREYGSGATGEWIILYTLLAIQLLYNILILRRLCGRDQPALVENRA